MPVSNDQVPFYMKATFVMVGLVTFFFIVYIGKSILAPLLFALLLAILLNPVVNFLNRHKIPRVLAIVSTLVVAIVLLVVIIFFISQQVALLSDNLPELKKSLSVMLSDISNWISEKFNVRPEQVNEQVEKMKAQPLESGSGAISGTLGFVSGFLVSALLIPVYVFMFLFYKSLLLDFLRRAAPKEQHETIAAVLQRIKKLIQAYLVGLLLEAAVVSILNISGLLLIGVDYAILFGILGALLNMIPYIGGIVAISLPTLMAIASGEPNDAFLVIGWYILVQLIDNNFIIPKIVASKVKINALVSIVVVLVGGALWGIPGMFFALPVIAIVKVICDNVDQLNAFGFLLGDNMPPLGKIIFRFRPLPEKGQEKQSSERKNPG